MVEAAHQHNPFAPQLDTSNYCPHMARLGICLEPEMCFLIHEIPGTKSAENIATMSTAAKSFNPFASSGAVSSQSKEFVPSAQESNSQTGII